MGKKCKEALRRLNEAEIRVQSLIKEKADLQERTAKLEKQVELSNKDIIAADRKRLLAGDLPKHTKFTCASCGGEWKPLGGNPAFEADDFACAMCHKLYDNGYTRYRTQATGWGRPASSYWVKDKIPKKTKKKRTIKHHPGKGKVSRKKIKAAVKKAAKKK